MFKHIFKTISHIAFIASIICGLKSFGKHEKEKRRKSHFDKLRDIISFLAVLIAGASLICHFVDKREKDKIRF